MFRKSETHRKIRNPIYRVSKALHFTALTSISHLERMLRHMPMYAPPGGMSSKRCGMFFIEVRQLSSFSSADKTKRTYCCTMTRVHPHTSLRQTSSGTRTDVHRTWSGVEKLDQSLPPSVWSFVGETRSSTHLRVTPVPEISVMDTGAVCKEQ